LEASRGGAFQEGGGIWPEGHRVRQHRVVPSADTGFQEAAQGLGQAFQGFSLQLRLPAGAEVLVHEQQHLEAVFGPPGLRPQAQQLELQAPAPGTLADQGVHAGGIGLQGAALRRAQDPGRGLGHLLEPIDPMKAVQGQGPGPHQLRQPPIGLAPHELHLEEPLPGHQVALDPKGVIEGVRMDGGEASLVQVHRNRRAEPRQGRDRRRGQLTPDQEGGRAKGQQEQGQEAQEQLFQEAHGRRIAEGDCGFSLASWSHPIVHDTR
jgi:hypothetical protein